MATQLPTAAEVFAISAVAKLGATLVTYPLLLVKQRLQACLSAALEAAQGAKQAYACVWEPTVCWTLHALACWLSELTGQSVVQSAGRHTHEDRVYSGTIDAVRRIWRTEGGCRAAASTFLQAG